MRIKDSYELIAVDLRKQKALDPDPRAIQQIVFQGVVGGDHKTKTTLDTILEQSKETVRILQMNSKTSVISINGWKMI